MPYAKTWSEELVAEWLQLEGFLVEISCARGENAGPTTWKKEEKRGQ